MPNDDDDDDDDDGLEKSFEAIVYGPMQDVNS